MRIEEREVTIKQSVYIADDGKEFEDEEECQDYEFDILRKSLKCYCYDSDFNQTDADNCTFAYLPTKSLVEKFINYCDVLGITKKGVDKSGIYMYSDYNNSWVNLDDITSRFKAVLNGKGEGE